MCRHRRHPAIPPGADSLDHPLGTTAIPNGPPCRGHNPLQSVIADKLRWPQRVKEFLAGDHPVAVLEEVGEEIEDFGLELQWDYQPDTAHSYAYQEYRRQTYTASSLPSACRWWTEEDTS